MRVVSSIQICQGIHSQSHSIFRDTTVACFLFPCWAALCGFYDTVTLVCCLVLPGDMRSAWPPDHAFGVYRAIEYHILTLISGAYTNVYEDYGETSLFVVAQVLSSL